MCCGNIVQVCASACLSYCLCLGWARRCQSGNPWQPKRRRWNIATDSFHLITACSPVRLFILVARGPVDHHCIGAHRRCYPKADGKALYCHEGLKDQPDVNAPSIFLLGVLSVSACAPEQKKRNVNTTVLQTNCVVRRAWAHSVNCEWGPARFEDALFPPSGRAANGVLF